MKRFRSTDTLASQDRGAAVALGNFDGVHLGHQSVIAQARAAAAELDAPLGVITFEPHPRSFFAPDAPAFRLMNAEARMHRVEKLGVERLFEIPFNQALASLSAEAFVNTVLHDRLGVRHIVVGADFRFGRGRSGDVDLLRSLGQTLGFGVTVAPLVSDEQGDFSSTAIRQALTEGRGEDAARILGHWHRVEGIVEKGDQRGRDLGFPTANISLEGLHPPRFGVYAALVDVLTGPNAGRYKGAVSIGVRPTFGENRPNLEVFLLDFDGDLYGQNISVALVSFQRPELKFDDLDVLVAQMHTDVAEIRTVLATLD